MSSKSRQNHLRQIVAPVARKDVRPKTTTVVNEQRTIVASADASSSAGIGSQTAAIVISDTEMADDSADSSDDEEDLRDAKTVVKTSHADSDDEEEEGDDDEEESDQYADAEESTPAKSKKTHERTDGEDSDDGENVTSFGDLLKGREDIVDVSAALASDAKKNGNGELNGHAEALHLTQRNSSSVVLSSGSSRSLEAPKLSSLATVLTQALHSDDNMLLESCLVTSDIETIRNTIERLSTDLVARLLTKLADRMHRRPGRAGSLMHWVHWSLVAHGGALVSKPQLMKKLDSLQRVMAERARGLTSLLMLKGKLDLLEGQMQLRQKIGESYADDQLSDADEAEHVVWVEGVHGSDGQFGAGGDEDFDSDDFDDSDSNALDIDQARGDSDEDEDELEGFSQGDDSADDDEDDVLEDDVAQHGEGFSDDEDSEMEDIAPPAKLQKTTSKSSKPGKKHL